MDQKYIKIYEYLENNYPAVAQDVFFGLELFANSLCYGMEAFQKDIMKKTNTGDFVGLSEIADYAHIIQDLKAVLDEYLVECSMKNPIDDVILEENIEEDDEKNVPNYKDYIVDDEIPHTLNEIFTYKKICGFMLDGIRYNVNTWQAALIKLCELLIEKDSTIFKTFLDQPIFKGRKNCYLSSSSNGNRYYHKLKNANIYVWTNLSTNMICELMKKMLRGYGLSINNLYIYLRADYTQLHFAENDDVTKGSNSDSTDKIGKYVRSTMRRLANNGYVFSSVMLSKLTNPEETKRLFGMGIAFFKEVKEGIDLSVQIKDKKGNSRYWKEVFEFNGKKYLIVSQWFEINRERFDLWLDSLKAV